MLRGQFRVDFDSLGGYDTRETGKVWDLEAAPAKARDA